MTGAYSPASSAATSGRGAVVESSFESTLTLEAHGHRSDALSASHSREREDMVGRKVQQRIVCLRAAVETQVFYRTGV